MKKVAYIYTFSELPPTQLSTTGAVEELREWWELKER